MKQFLSKFGFLLTIAVIVGFLAVIRMTVPMYFISSGSMEPTLPVGTIVLEVPADQLQKGDIITFLQDGQASPTTHTFVGFDDDGGLMTMGDANPTPDVRDTPLTVADVKGKVFAQIMIFVPSFWLSTKGLGVILLAAAGAFLFLTRDKKKSSQESEPQPETTDEETHHLTPA